MMRQPENQSPESRATKRRIPGLWSHRELLWQFTMRNVELRHKGSYLGLVWSILNPLLTLALYVFVFGYVYRSQFNVLPDESRMDYALGVFLGLCIYHFLAEVIATSPAMIVTNPNLVKKVVFPLEVLPAAAVGASLIHMLISLTLVFVGVVTLGPGLGVRAFWIVVILFPLVPLALGIAWFFSALGVFFRDVGQVVGILSLGLMFASAIFYPASSLPPLAWSILRFNPILLAVELARSSVMWNHPLNLMHLAYLFGISFAVFILGYSFFRRTAPAFADVL
jgi:lipopolysaccharide transport system permease protein